METFVALDFETANPKRVSACAIGFAKVLDGNISETGSHLVCPVGGHAPFQTKIHGITEKDTCTCHNFGELFSQISDLFNFPIVAHSGFDKQVLSALDNEFCLGLDFEYYDTSAIAKSKVPGLKNYKLKTLVKHFQLPAFQHHDAGEDALACARLYMALNGIEQNQPANSAGDWHKEFRYLVQDILADDVVDYKEAVQLLYWLENQGDLSGEYGQLEELTRRFLEDGILDSGEAKMLKWTLQGILAIES